MLTFLAVIWLDDKSSSSMNSRNYSWSICEMSCLINFDLVGWKKCLKFLTFFLACMHIFIQCIQEGVRYLMRMLQVRNTVKLSDGVVLHDSGASILSEGKYVHLWIVKLCYAFLFVMLVYLLVFWQVFFQTPICWQWCTLGKCVSGPSSMRTAALTLQTTKMTASSFGTSVHRFWTNTWMPARDLCRARAGIQKMPRKYLVFYSEINCSYVKVTIRRRSEFSVQMCQTQISMELHKRGAVL